MRATLFLLLLLPLLSIAVGAHGQQPDAPTVDDPKRSVQELVAAGDEAFARRAEGAVGAVALPGPIQEALGAYREALEAAPDRIDIRVRLLRSLFFLARYATPNPSRQKALYEEGRTVFEQGLERIVERLGERPSKADPEELPELLADEPLAGELYFWGAVHWGLWGESFGTMASIRRGVAGKIRRYGESARVLVPEYQEAGALRLLGRLHALAPRVPLFTGWVDHDLAVEYLEEAVEIAPDDPLNRFFLADALLEYRHDQRDRALRLLQSAANAVPRSPRIVEDTEAIRDAQARLREVRGS